MDFQSSRSQAEFGFDWKGNPVLQLSQKIGTLEANLRFCDQLVFQFCAAQRQNFHRLSALSKPTTDSLW